MKGCVVAWSPESCLKGKKSIWCVCRQSVRCRFLMRQLPNRNGRFLLIVNDRYDENNYEDRRSTLETGLSSLWRKTEMRIVETN